MRRTLEFFHEIGNILYIGGILSHIVIGALFAGSDPSTTVTVYTYKLQSAYIMILPGLGLKIVSDLLLFFVFKEQAWWMKIKLACTAFLAANAFIFLVPMMPQLLSLAENALESGVLPEQFHDLEHREQLVGMSNILPLITEVLMGAFRPAISRRERTQPK